MLQFFFKEKSEKRLSKEWWLKQYFRQWLRWGWKREARGTIEYTCLFLRACIRYAAEQHIIASVCDVSSLGLRLISHMSGRVPLTWTGEAVFCWFIGAVNISSPALSASAYFPWLSRWIKRNRRMCESGRKKNWRDADSFKWTQGSGEIQGECFPHPRISTDPRVDDK